MPADAFYLPLGDDRFESTEHTGGPWDPGLQHAGPPSALLTRLIEQTPAPWPAVITRITVDILGPVPVATLEARTSVVRSGRSVELVAAELATAQKQGESRVAIRAHAWRVRRAELELPPLPSGELDAAVVPPFPDEETTLPDTWGGGYLHAMQWRVAAGSWTEPGPASVWGRMRYPLLPDEEPSGLQRVMVIADSGNGVSNVLPLDRWLFINPDLTVHVAAAPSGDWICLDAATRIDPNGFGLAASRLFDRERLVARGAQTLLVSNR